MIFQCLGRNPIPRNTQDSALPKEWKKNFTCPLISHTPPTLRLFRGGNKKSNILFGTKKKKETLNFLYEYYFDSEQGATIPDILETYIPIIFIFYALPKYVYCMRKPQFGAFLHVCAKWQKTTLADIGSSHWKIFQEKDILKL